MREGGSFNISVRGRGGKKEIGDRRQKAVKSCLTFLYSSVIVNNIEDEQREGSGDINKPSLQQSQQWRRR
jgi:hypothetical protein